MKSDIVLRIEKALKEYTPSKIDGVRIATARGILTAYEIAVLNGLSEAGKVDCIKVCESFMLPPITCGITNPEEHYITCEKKNYRGDVIKTFKAFDLPTELITLCFEIKSTVSDFKSPNGHKTWWVILTTTLCRQTRSSSLKSWGYSTKCRHISALSLHTKDATVN